MMDHKEIGLIYKLCEAYGYGNVMQCASSLWRMDAQKRGYPENGCFVPVPLAFVDGENKTQANDSHKIYKSHIDAYFGRLEEHQMR